MHEGLWTLMQTNHKWFALMISESSCEMPDLEVLYAKKSWFNSVKTKKWVLTLTKLVRTDFSFCPQGAAAKRSVDRSGPRIRCCCFVCAGAEGGWQSSAQRLYAKEEDCSRNRGRASRACNVKLRELLLICVSYLAAWFILFFFLSDFTLIVLEFWLDL